jgi:hypothetical protein
MAFNPREIAKAGRKVYERLAESPEAAFRKAAAEHIEGPFHLVRVGERAAFRSRRLPHADATRLAR